MKRDFKLNIEKFKSKVKIKNVIISTIILNMILTGYIYYQMDVEDKYEIARLENRDLKETTRLYSKYEDGTKIGVRQTKADTLQKTLKVAHNCEKKGS